MNTYEWVRIGPAFVRPEDNLIRLPIKGPKGRQILMQRSSNLIDWADWKTATIGQDGCELIDHTAEERQFFYRAIAEDPSQ